MNEPVSGLLRRDRVVVAAGLSALTALSWIYLWQGAGMGMSALDMTRLALFPHTLADPMLMPPTAWPIVALMWWIMMVAMMTPSAAPLILLHARVVHHAAAHGRADARVPSSLLAIGYLLSWLLFSLAATGLQIVLQHTGLLSPMWLSSTSAPLSALLLVTAGLYQLSSLKHACLRRCRGPVAFLTTHWHPGPLGALRMGIEHGAWCVGCCALLMLLLFVGGVMNLLWIALLALLVLAERLLRAGPVVGRASGLILIVWGLATLLV